MRLNPLRAHRERTAVCGSPPGTGNDDSGTELVDGQQAINGLWQWTESPVLLRFLALTALPCLWSLFSLPRTKCGPDPRFGRPTARGPDSIATDTSAFASASRRTDPGSRRRNARGAALGWRPFRAQSACCQFPARGRRLHKLTLRRLNPAGIPLDKM